MVDGRVPGLSKRGDHRNVENFSLPRRVLPEIQDGWNPKGLISEEGKKKKAFFVPKDFYEKKPGSGKSQ